MTTRVPIQSLPNSAWQLPRRELLKRLLGGVAAASVLSSISGTTSSLAQAARTLENDQERFWHFVKAQFPVRSGLILMNAANLCPSPYPVLETVFGLTRDMDADASFQNRDKFSGLREYSRLALANLLGASPEEIAIVRNTSEANNMVINGLSLKQGDEVVLGAQNHPTNNVAWDVRAERFGFTVKRVKTPVLPHSPEELVKPFQEALTKNTKVLSMTHASNISGLALPVKELCHRARQRGILTLIDGAQTFGALQVNLHDVGCDFYTGSTHKWLVGPKEAGVLYVRKECIAELWPTVVGAGWEDAVKKGAQKFESLGQRDDATVAAVGKAVDFLTTLGKDRVEARIRELSFALKSQIRKIPRAKLHTPMEPELSAGVVVFALDGIDPQQAFQTLYRKSQVAGAAMGGSFAGIRLCPHIYNPMDEIDRVVAAVAEIAKKGIS